VPRRRGKNTTLLASMSLEGMGPALAVEGATTALVFEAYVERVLAPSLKEGQMVVMDNLGAHRPKRVRELIEERGYELLYLPSYSPDYNPIEEAFAKIKDLLRKTSARTKGTLVEAMAAALSAISARDVRDSSSMPDTALRLTYCEKRAAGAQAESLYLLFPELSLGDALHVVRWLLATAPPDRPRYPIARDLLVCQVHADFFR
jgi:transposase